MRPVLLTVLRPSLATASGFQRLHSEQATATSFLKSTWNKYEESSSSIKGGRSAPPR